MCKLFKKKKLPLSESLLQIKKDVKKLQKRQECLQPLTLEEQLLIQQIKGMTRSLNLNNVTRTKAYLNFYKAHPEIHWAFLGHMVSRNGGWNMTDLKGGQLSRLLTRKEAQVYFSFLERGNWLIFQDVFPQFLLYKASKRYQQNLFYLLPYFHVSIFMESIWNHFWERQDTYTLTVAQIINEQSYLEDRVISNTHYKKEVFDTLEFKLQDLLDLNHILFPFEEKGKIHLIGQTLHQFKSVRERILLGKRLYSILFADKKRLKSVETWAIKTQHTGSRKDYWPQIFNNVDEGLPGFLLKSRVKSCELTKGSPRIYSPRLEMAWKNRKHKPAEIGDWYKDWEVLFYLTHDREKVDGEILHEYCKTLEKFELAAIAKKAISILD
ncbi:DUF2515 domain-containing protein [Bacillus sp. REN16]|uniref:DUF2515 domain-containing protein n=1 Tax=Bacillus sp. REN16 TaxID=2887296 RepID=UPI001E484BFA|nr:DUF2515 domain-containing protein [Bacillus sp. REN16]MCC3357314.1 DUF2515 domain-containing protein [Bacillus sp. REN16]